ncbi:MAG: hypothetical protein QOH62_897, partial [Solirubrobacteraceae bacterium]|nr:hypothetical protein [Solirubrobacteraceae bacterium]
MTVWPHAELTRSFVAVFVSLTS